MMPTVLRIGPYRFFFYSSDWNEPMHIHIEQEHKIAKIWLDPVRLQDNGGFNRSELNKVLSIIKDNQQDLMEAWNEFFSD